MFAKLSENHPRKTKQPIVTTEKSFDEAKWLITNAGKSSDEAKHLIVTAGKQQIMQGRSLSRKEVK